MVIEQCAFVPTKASLVACCTSKSTVSRSRETILPLNLALLRPHLGAVSHLGLLSRRKTCWSKPTGDH